MKKRIPLITLLAALAWLLGSGAAVAQKYSFQDLGHLGSGGSIAWGINDAGQVVGQSSNADYVLQAFEWDPATQTMLNLPDLGSGNGCAYAISNLGQVAGSADYYNAKTGYYELHPVLWDANHTIKDLGNLNGAGTAEALALNDNGRTAGYLYNSLGYLYAFTWNPPNTRTLLPKLGPSASDTEALGINNQGEVVGDSQDPNYNSVAFFWTSGASRLTNLGTLGGVTSTAYALNNHSQVVGGADRADYTRHAFLWDSVNQMQDLDPLSHFSDSEAYGINLAGQVVGAFDVYGYPTSAFLWTAAGSMQDLNNLVANLPPDTHLDVANGINQAGQIVGNYSTTYGSGAFLLTPVKPAVLPTLQLLLLE